MIEKLVGFIREAGQAAMARYQQDDLSVGNKGESQTVNSVVTETDLKISRMFRNFAAENFSHLNYLIIDEECVAELGNQVFEKSAAADYQFVIDPVDGTILFADGIPLFGIIIGVMKKNRPWLGLVYLPVLDELVFTDGTKVWWEQKGRRQEVEPQLQNNSYLVMGHNWLLCPQCEPGKEKMILADFFSAASYFLFLCTNRARGAFLKAYLWDIAGGWAIAKVLGIGFYDYETKAEMEEFGPAFFRNDCFMARMVISCREEDYPAVKGLVSGLK